MTEQTQTPQDDDDRPVDGGDAPQGPPQPTVRPEAADPDREGEERFDAG